MIPFQPFSETYVLILGARWEKKKSLSNQAVGQA